MPDDILNRVISLISGTESGGDDKQILLRQLVREVQQNKYAKLYRARQEEADVSFAQYFYSIYRIVYASRNFLKKPGIMAKVKQVALESYLDKPVMNVVKRLTPEAVMERRKNATEDFSAELEADLLALTAGFDSPRLTAADKCYSLIIIFQRFVSYDYFALLRKFDPELQEGFTFSPKFSPLRADTIMADLASFLAILPPFEPDNDWRTVLEIFKYCNGGTALLPYENWTGLLGNLRDLKQSKILETIVRLASKNPIWEVKPVPPTMERLSSDWLAEKTFQVRQVINNIAENQKNAKIAALEREVFAAPDVTRLAFFNKERGKILVQKEVNTYIYAPALNHLMAFIQDFMNKEMAELSDLLLVRGQWTKNAASISMSEAYHTIREIIPSINELDESLSENGSYGPRLRGALLRVDRDASQARYLSSLVDMVNEEALTIINKVVPSFIELGKHLNLLVEDCQKKANEHIMNWKELILISKPPLGQRLADDYKKLNYFIQLMYLEAKVEDEEEDEEE